MTWQKFDRENGPWQWEFVFDGYHIFASNNTFACGPTGAIFAFMYKEMLFLSIISKMNKHYFSLRNLDFYKWCAFKSAQCIMYFQSVNSYFLWIRLIGYVKWFLAYLTWEYNLKWDLIEVTIWATSWENLFCHMRNKGTDQLAHYLPLLFAA